MIMIHPKRIFAQSFRVLSVALLLAFCIPAPRAAAQYDDAYVSYNDFYDNLAPYGQWVDDPQYGYVWSPNEDNTFRPYYSNGHWVMTDYGNTWISDYPWGWATFHYGRWTYDNYYGWLWIPGSNWGPAWVSWRGGEGYYGWAPLGPGYDLASTYNDYSCPSDWWVFIPPQYLYSGSYYHYWYGPHSNSQIIGNTNFVNNTYVTNRVTYVNGPRAREIEDRTHQPVQVYKVTNSTSNLNTRVKHNVVKMYRPAEIRPAASVNGHRATPPNVVSAPQAVRAPQAINSGQTTPPQFRNRLPTRAEVPGTNISETATPVQTRRRNDNNPYEWDVNKPVQQNQRSNAAPQSAPQPQRQQAPGNNSAPATTRQAPAPAPAQQTRPAPTPKPQMQNNSGGRR